MVNWIIFRLLRVVASLMLPPFFCQGRSFDFFLCLFLQQYSVLSTSVLPLLDSFFIAFASIVWLYEFGHSFLHLKFSVLYKLRYWLLKSNIYLEWFYQKKPSHIKIKIDKTLKFRVFRKKRSHSKITVENLHGIISEGYLKKYVISCHMSSLAYL